MSDTAAGWTSARTAALLRRPAAGSAVAAAMLASALLATAWNIRAGASGTALVRRATALADRAESVLSAAKDLETGERGFLLTGEETFLEPYRVGEARLAEHFASEAADAATGGAPDNGPAAAAPAEAGRAVSALRRLVEAKRAVAARAIAVRRAKGLDAAMAFVRSGADKSSMDAIRVEVAAIRQHLAARIGARERRGRTREVVLTVLSLGLAMTACAWFVALAVLRRRREQASNALLGGVLDNAPIGLGFLDRALRVRHLNKALAAMGERRFGADIGLELWEVLPQLRRQIEPQLRAVVDEGRSIRNVEAEIAPSGEPGLARICLMSFYPLRAADAARTIEGAGMVVADITERRQAELAVAAARDAAEDANRAKSTFIANMSHELRTPLSAIIGYSEMLQEEIEDSGDPANIAPDMRKIEGNARHLLGLINDVLDLSKVESGKMEVYAEEFDVAAMVRDVASTVAGLVGKKGNTLSLALADDLGAMHSDITKIRQILLNLLSNAAKFTEGGTITLSATRVAAAGGPDANGPDANGEGSVAFAVRDAGIGMTAEQLAKLFQRFQQADASTTRRFGGTGLGLSITQAFSTMLGGAVAVASMPGQGSTFTVTLPARFVPPPEPQEAAQDDAGSEGAGGVDGARGVVLVIDDDPAQLELTARFLEREGFAARIAPDGRTGLALARSLRPRAILLDVAMPGMDGWSVLARLKADPALAAIPVVMVTFLAERGLASSLGAAGYVSKPVHWDRLRAVMDRFRDAEGDVLVVDDDADARVRLRAVLERDGWSVAEAADGEAALACVEAAVPRVVLLDLVMPVMDGFAFLHALRARPGCADVPVVVLTARDLTAEDRSRLRGASQVLAKGEATLRDIAAKLRALVPAAGQGNDAS